MATGIFVDTAGWGNIIDPDQEFHALATRLYRDARAQTSPIITTSYVTLPRLKAVGIFEHPCVVGTGSVCGVATTSIGP
jgi:hypothetical protein